MNRLLVILTDPVIVVCPLLQQFQLLFIRTLKRVELELKIDLTVVIFQLKTEFHQKYRKRSY